MIVPVAMRNYQEREILGGLIKLRKYDRVDLFYGYFKDVERDFIYSHLFILMLAFLVFVYILLQSINPDENIVPYYGNL